MFTMMIAGRLGADAETRFTQAGNSVTGFRVAVDVYRGKERGNETEWVDCSLWGERGEALAEHLKQGTHVTVMGEPGARAYESKQDGSLKAALQLRVLELTLGGGGKRHDGGDRAPQGRAAPSRAPASRGQPARTERPQGRAAAQPPPDRGNDPFPDDDIPF